jgi:23S rRNA pseudouridine2605 synthase/16S rRNA pseudouridine516 synthase
VASLPRLQKFLAEAGVASRRKCEEYIRAGRVRVNGQVVDRLGVTVDPHRDRVEVDGREVRPEPKAYLMLYKPRGYVTTAHDPQGRPKVTDLVAGLPQRVFPVGRLDVDSEGLLLLTNDGELAYRLTHPRFKVPKTYAVVLDRTPDLEALQRIASGIELEDGPTAPCVVRLLRGDRRHALVEMTIHEGRNRQVRRMWAALGYEVKRLKRTSVANLKLMALRPGQYRRLRTDELRRLRELLGLSK